jgi:hypothetical protein
MGRDDTRWGVGCVSPASPVPHEWDGCRRESSQSPMFFAGYLMRVAP